MDKQNVIGLMTETLEAGLSGLRGQPIKIRELHREHFSRSTSFSTERWRVLLNDGEWLGVFFKDLNPLHQLDVARIIRKLELDRSRRELWIYQHILSRLQLGTPQLYAFRWEPQRGLIWLLLEHAGEPFVWVGDFQHYLAAARWAARFHAAVRDIPAAQTNFLIHHDQTHYHHCGERLEQNLSKFDAQQRQVIHQALDCYNGIIDHLNNLPRCLIHGEFFSENIVVRPRPHEQISVIDWETAALGPSYVDLVSISAGQWTPEQRQAMWRAYFEQYQAETGLTMNWDSFCQDVGYVALYRALWWLGWWANHDSAHIARWMQELDQMMPNRIRMENRAACVRLCKPAR